MGNGEYRDDYQCEDKQNHNVHRNAIYKEIREDPILKHAEADQPGKHGDCHTMNAQTIYKAIQAIPQKSLQENHYNCREYRPDCKLCFLQISLEEDVRYDVRIADTEHEDCHIHDIYEKTFSQGGAGTQQAEYNPHSQQHHICSS